MIGRPKRYWGDRPPQKSLPEQLAVIVNSGYFANTPELRELESRARLLLGHAAIEHSRYGAGDDRPLNEYSYSSYADTVHAHFRATNRLGPDQSLMAETHSNLRLHLGARSLIVVHDSTYYLPDSNKYEGRTDHAELNSINGLITAHRYDPSAPLDNQTDIKTSKLTGDALAQFDATVRRQIDLYGIDLSSIAILQAMLNRKDDGLNRHDFLEG